MKKIISQIGWAIFFCVVILALMMFFAWIDNNPDISGRQDSVPDALGFWEVYAILVVGALGAIIGAAFDG